MILLSESMGAIFIQTTTIALTQTSEVAFKQHSNTDEAKEMAQWLEA